MVYMPYVYMIYNFAYSWPIPDLYLASTWPISSLSLVDTGDTDGFNDNYSVKFVTPT